MNAVNAIAMTIAVRIIACASGSATFASSWTRDLRPMIGGAPAEPPACRMSRLAPLPMSMRPSIILVIARSSTRYTPAEMRVPAASSRKRFATIYLSPSVPVVPVVLIALRRSAARAIDRARSRARCLRISSSWSS